MKIWKAGKDAFSLDILLSPLDSSTNVTFSRVFKNYWEPKQVSTVKVSSVNAHQMTFCVDSENLHAV